MSIPRMAVLLVMVAILASETMASVSTVDETPRPLRIFILAGQSNMQGHAHVRTFDVMALDPQTAPLLRAMRNADGSPRVCDDVWITSIGSSADQRIGRLTAGFGAEGRGPKIGPEFTFGITMAELVDGPILIIKTAWGGKSLHTDFRPPSAGPYEFNEAQLAQFARQGKDVDAIVAERTKASGQFYRLMMEHVRRTLADISRVYPDYDPEHGYELAGFVWFQGWNDMVDRGVYPTRNEPGGYGQYSALLAQFIRDVRRDLERPDLPFVIGVMGVGGPLEKYTASQQRYKAVHGNFRDAMAAPAAMPEFSGTVVAVRTAPYWDMEVVALRAREQTIKPRVDELNARIEAGTLSRDEGAAAREQLYAETFTERELTILRDGVSNAEYHYLGSAKIMAQIGRAFAEAMHSMAASSSVRLDRVRLPGVEERLGDDMDGAGVARQPTIGSERH